MENKNESKILEKDEVLSKESKEAESPETSEINDDGSVKGNHLEKTKEIDEESEEIHKTANEGKAVETAREKKEENVTESKIETKEFDQLIEDVNRFNESFEISKTKKPKIFDKFKGLLSKKGTADQKDYENLSQDISKRVFEYRKVNPDILSNDSIKEFLEKTKEIASERADRVDEKIEELNKKTAEEIEKVNKERPGLFDKISARFKKNGLEIVIALGLLAMLAAMPREALLDKIASGDVGMQINTLLSQLNLPQIHSFLPAKYANLTLIASTAAVLRVAKSDFLTRNIRKYFGSKDSKEEVTQGEELKESEGFDISSQEKVVEKKDIKESFDEVVELAEYQKGEIDNEEKKEAEDNDIEESFNQVAASAEYQEAFKKYQEGELDNEEMEINKEELEMLNALKEIITKGEKVEVKYKKGLDWEFGYYVADIKEEKGKRPSVSLKKFQGSDAKYTNVDLSEIEFAKKKY
jgi:hypothetical protein